MGLLKRNNFGVRLSAIVLPSIFLAVGSARQVIAAKSYAHFWCMRNEEAASPLL